MSKCTDLTFYQKKHFFNQDLITYAIYLDIHY